MSEINIRDHTRYFGQLANIFTILNEFENQPTRLRFNFETFASSEIFDSGAMPPGRLRREFTLESDALETFSTENSEVLKAIKDTALNIAGVGGRGWDLSYLYISTISKVLLITAENPTNREKTTISKPGAAFDETVQSNLDLIKQAIGITWNYAKSNDGFLNQMTPSEEFTNFIIKG